MCSRDLIQGKNRLPASTRRKDERRRIMRQMLFFVFSSFWAGAVHAATPGHGKTIAAAYIVGARGKPIDAVILGVFVTLSHTSGIVLVGVLASLGSVWLRPQRIEAYLALAMGLVVIGLGLWMLWLQRGLIAYAMGEPSPAPAALAAQGGRVDTATAGHSHHADAHASDHLHDHSAEHDHTHGSHHSHDHAHDEHMGWHTHGWGTYHSHRLDAVTDQRPKLAVLLALGIAGGLLPDPTALALLIAALSSGKVLLGMITVLVFSLGFAATLVVVGVIAAQVGQRVLDWLTSVWAVRLQIATTLLILGMGVVLTVKAATQLGTLPS
jgi:nickel/cobalt exporter